MKKIPLERVIIAGLCPASGETMFFFSTRKHVRADEHVGALEADEWVSSDEAIDVSDTPGRFMTEEELSAQGVTRAEATLQHLEDALHARIAERLVQEPRSRAPNPVTIQVVRMLGTFAY